MSRLMISNSALAGWVWIAPASSLGKCRAKDLGSAPIIGVGLREWEIEELDQVECREGWFIPARSGRQGRRGYFCGRGSGGGRRGRGRSEGGGWGRGESWRWRWGRHAQCEVGPVAGFATALASHGQQE